MYWVNDEIAVPPGFMAWKNLYPEFRIFGDRDVFPLLPPQIAPIWNKIRLPAAKSDLARLLLLREYGGLYVDAHVGPTDPAQLVETLDLLSAYSLVLTGKGWAMKTAADFDMQNGIILARRKSPEIDLIINKVTDNILEQYVKETASPAYSPYSLWGVTGTYPLMQTFFEIRDHKQVIKAQFEQSVHLHLMRDNVTSGFEIAAFKTYHTEKNHWSVREKNERFFID